MGCMGGHPEPLGLRAGRGADAASFTSPWFLLGWRGSGDLGAPLIKGDTDIGIDINVDVDIELFRYMAVSRNWGLLWKGV